MGNKQYLLNVDEGLWARFLKVLPVEMTIKDRLISWIEDYTEMREKDERQQ